jgi:1-acyl-sn-glycerol-3-phosphate acyltransferase
VSRRPLRIFVAAEWVAWRPLRQLFRIMDAIPVDRDRRNPDSLEAAVAALERGEVVALFPEGGIRNQGTLGPFRQGTARLVLRTGVPVLPAVIIGSYEAQPWPRMLPRPSRITIRSGELLRFPARTEGRPRPDELAAVTDRIREAMRGLLERGHDERSLASSPALGGERARGTERPEES